MFRSLPLIGRALDRTLLGAPAKALRHMVVASHRQGYHGLARAIDWSADALWTVGGHGYWHSSDPKRKVLQGWKPKRATINQALQSDLPTLVAQGRMLDRATPVYRGLVEGRKAELVGTGIGIEPMTGDKGLDKVLRELWNEQASDLGHLGESLWELQRIASGEIDAGGSVLWRGLVLPERIDDGLIPWCVMSIPREWCTDQPVVALPTGHQFVAGIETDRLGRSIAAHLRNPDDPSAPGERVLLGRDSRLIFERRWSLQATGSPRLDTLVERTLQDDEIVNNEMKCARVAGALAVIVADDELRQAYLDGHLPSDFMDIEGGTVSIVGANSQVSSFSHDRPSPNTKNWRETVRGDMAAGASVSRVWTDRDGSQYNFANSKFDQIRTQMMVKPAQDWFGKAVASWPYQQALPYLMILAGKEWPADAMRQRRLSRHRLVPDIPPELDEKAAAEAFEKSNKNGIDSRADFLSRRGKDPQQMAAQIEAEAREDAAKAVERIAVAQQLCDAMNRKNPNLKLHWSHIVSLPGATSAPGAYLQAAAPPQAQPAAEEPAKPQPEPDEDDDVNRQQFDLVMRRLDLLDRAQPGVVVQSHYDIKTADVRALGEAIGAALPQTIVNVPQQAAPAIHVAPAQVRIEQAAQEPATVVVNVPQQAPATITVQPSPVNIDNQVIVPSRPVIARPNADGSVTMTPQDQD
jgi:capsid protein